MIIATIRQWHSYIGLLIAPSVLFFALTGALQIFSLHEAHGNYHPPAVIEKLSSVHKDQVFAIGHHHDQSAPKADAGKPNAGDDSRTGTDDDKPLISTILLKAFFLLVALCLALTTAFGLWMGFAQTRRRRLALVLVVVGTLIPIGLMLSS